ncbi:MAG: hypothetical protein JW924_08525 [Fusobacteriaceae bacterium]|nr:hypothetical protein [Fusobacteriaceae bacterium]
MRRIKNSFKIGQTDNQNIYIIYVGKYVFIINSDDLNNSKDFFKSAYDYWESNIIYKDIDINKSINFCKEFFDNFIR